MQVALYARVSTSQQEKTDTIESQLKALHTYVDVHGHTVLPEHIFLDNGVSGSRLDRPALDRLRDQARLGDFEAVIILSPDRFARSYPHQWVLLEEFKKYGCSVIFMENPFGDSPHGQLLAQMQGMIAEYERTQIADRTRRGRLHKAQKGECLPWAYRTYGYRYIPTQAGLLPRVEIHPEQAVVVQDMFRWLIHEQLTTRQIVKRLNALKIPTRTGQNAVWHVASVRCMLSNPLYAGQGHYNRTKSGVPRKETRRKFRPRTDNYAREPRPPEEWVPITAPALISAETFATAQEQLKQNQVKARRAYQPTSQRYLLRTLVRCGLCQLHMQAARQLSVCKRYESLYYCCAGKDAVTVGRVEPCPSRRVRADRLDTLVWTLVRELLQDPQVILQEYTLWQQVQQGQQGQFHDQLHRIDMQSYHLERQLQRLIDAYQQEIITLHDLSIRREQIGQRLKGLEQERKNLEQQRDTTIKWEHIADNIGHFRALLGSNLDRLSFEDRQAVVQLLVEKVVVHPDGAVDVHHILPFEEQPVAANQKKKVIPAEFYVLRLKHLDEPTSRMALDNITCPPTQVGGDQRAIELFCCIGDRHDASCGFVGADIQPCTPDHRHHLIAASDAEGGGRPGRGGTVVRDVLVTLADPHVLRAADVREHVSAPEKGRGALDKRRRAIERLRHDRVHPDSGRLGLAGREQAQGEWFCAGRMRVGCRCARPLCGGDTLRLEGLIRFIPRPDLRGGRIADNPYGQGDCRGHEAEKNAALPPERAATCFLAQFLQRGERLGRWRARMVGVVDDEAARGDAMVPQDAPHTGHQELCPGTLAVSQQPGEGRHRLRAEAGACKTRPAHGGGHEHGGETKRQPGLLCDGQRVMGLMRAHGGVNGVNKGTHEGGWLSHHQRRLQAIGGAHDQRA